MTELQNCTTLKVFGRNLSRMRKSRGLKQVEFAAKLGYTSTGTISQIETGLSAPSFEKVLLMAEVLEVPIQVLLSQKEWSPADVRRITQFCDILKHRDKLLAFPGADDLLTMMHQVLQEKKLV
jgi:transcriptional regulator with XRE-family HTH domain